MEPSVAEQDNSVMAAIRDVLTKLDEQADAVRELKKLAEGMNARVEAIESRLGAGATSPTTGTATTSAHHLPPYGPPATEVHTHHRQVHPTTHLGPYHYRIHSLWSEGHLASSGWSVLNQERSYLSGTIM